MTGLAALLCVILVVWLSSYSPSPAASVGRAAASQTGTETETNSSQSSGDGATDLTVDDRDLPAGMWASLVQAARALLLEIAGGVVLLFLGLLATRVWFKDLGWATADQMAQDVVALTAEYLRTADRGDGLRLVDYQDLPWRDILDAKEHLDIICRFAEDIVRANPAPIMDALERGAAVRILLPDPSDAPLMTLSDAQRANSSGRAQATLDELANILKQDLRSKDAHVFILQELPNYWAIMRDRTRILMGPYEHRFDVKDRAPALDLDGQQHPDLCQFVRGDLSRLERSARQILAWADDVGDGDPGWKDVTP